MILGQEENNPKTQANHVLGRASAGVSRLGQTRTDGAMHGPAPQRCVSLYTPQTHSDTQRCMRVAVARRQDLAGDGGLARAVEGREE